MKTSNEILIKYYKRSDEYRICFNYAKYEWEFLFNGITWNFTDLATRLAFANAIKKKNFRSYRSDIKFKVLESPEICLHLKKCIKLYWKLKKNPSFTNLYLIESKDIKIINRNKIL